MVTESQDPVVLVVDDDPDTRGALERMLEAAGYRVQTYSSPREILERYDPSVAGCLLIDLRLPGMNGLELYDALRGRGCEHPFIVVTAHGEIACAVEAIQFGALDFIEKPFRNERLLSRIREALEIDQRTRHDRAARRVIEQRLQSLTDRERQILDFVLDGRLSKEIARELGISIKTVEVHRSKLMKKMKADSIHELVRMTIEAGYSDYRAPGLLEVRHERFRPVADATRLREPSPVLNGRG